jgi:hypothetical protein
LTEKVVYDPKKHAAKQKNAATKKSKKAAKSTKTKKKNDKIVVDAKAHANDGADVEPEESVTQFKAKLNKYGFIHITKSAWKSLPFEKEKSLTARIEGEKWLSRQPRKNQPEKV